MFPDLRDPIFQQQIIDELELQRKQTNKNPILILDNLRSLSAYEENDADSWLPIGKFLLQLLQKHLPQASAHLEVATALCRRSTGVFALYIADPARPAMAKSKLCAPRIASLGMPSVLQVQYAR